MLPVRLDRIKPRHDMREALQQTAQIDGLPCLVGFNSFCDFLLETREILRKRFDKAGWQCHSISRCLKQQPEERVQLLTDLKGKTLVKNQRVGRVEANFAGSTNDFPATCNSFPIRLKIQIAVQVRYAIADDPQVVQ